MDLPAINCYVIRVNTIDNLYTDYMVEAKNIREAKEKTKKAFFRDFPKADKNIKLSIEKPDSKVITEIMNIIKEATNVRNITETRFTTSNSEQC